VPGLAAVQLGSVSWLDPSELTPIAARHHATQAQAALAWLLGLSPAVIAIPGARRPESARSAARAAALELGTDEQATLTVAFGGARATPLARASADLRKPLLTGRS